MISQATETALKAKLGSRPDYFELHNGEWANHLQDGALIPVGRTIGGQIIKELLLDFSFFEEKVNAVLGQKAKAWLEATKPWAENACTKVNHRELCEVLLYSQLAQNIVDGLLQTKIETNLIMRENKYRESDLKLSDFIGLSACLERAALGKFVLQKLGVNCAYMSGMHATLSGDRLSLEGHSFLVLTDQGLIWDVAQKHSEGVARILIPEKEFSLERFISLSPQEADQPKNGLVFCKNLLKPERGSYYGVGIGPVTMRFSPE